MASRRLFDGAEQEVGGLPLEATLNVLTGTLDKTLDSVSLISSGDLIEPITGTLTKTLGVLTLSGIAQFGEPEKGVFQQIWIIDSRKSVSKRKTKRAKKVVQEITNSINAINRDIVDNAVSVALLTRKSEEIAKQLEELEKEEAFFEAKRKAEIYAEKVIKKALNTLKETAQKEAVKEARRQTTLRALRDALKYAEQQEDLEDLKLVMSLL